MPPLSQSASIRNFLSCTKNWMAIYLFIFCCLPIYSRATTINLQDIRTENSLALYGIPVSPTALDSNDRNTPEQEFSSRNNNPTEPDILKVYENLFRQTMELSPEIQVARRLLAQKSAEKYSSWANRLSPHVDLEISRKRFFNRDHSADETATTESDMAQTSGDSSGEYQDGDYVSDWNFDLDLPIYKRSLSVEIDIVAIEYELAANNLEIKTRELDTRLHELLANYMVACYKLLNLGNSIVISREHVDKILRGYELRDQTKLELLRAQANLKELEARKDLNIQQRDSTFRELLDYTAIPEFSPGWFRLNELLDTEERTAGCINVFAKIEDNIGIMRAYLAESTSDMALKEVFTRNSLIYKNIMLERHLGKTRAKKYTQNNWPEVAVRGELDRRTDTRFEDYQGEGSVGLVLSIPLFSGGTIFSNNRTEEMAAQIAAIQEQSGTLRSFNSIANKKKSINSLLDVREKQLVHLRQQEEIVRLSLKSYQIKQTSMQDLLTSKNNLIDAKNLLMRTTADLGILLRQFAWELGMELPAPATGLPKQNSPLNIITLLPE